VKRIVAHVPCSGCGQLTPSTDGLHIEGTLRDGYHGPVVGEENSEYFFCSLDCLYEFMSSNGASQVSGGSWAAWEKGEPSETEPQGDGGRGSWEETQEKIQEDPQQESQPIPPSGARKIVHKSLQREAPAEGEVKEPPRVIKTVSKKVPNPVRARKLFQGEEPIGYSLPKGLPNTGNPPSELKQYVRPPVESLRAMEEEMKAKLKASRPPEE
jgi:hypothetical protein